MDVPSRSFSTKLAAGIVSVKGDFCIPAGQVKTHVNEPAAAAAPACPTADVSTLLSLVAEVALVDILWAGLSTFCGMFKFERAIYQYKFYMNISVVKHDVNSAVVYGDSMFKTPIKIHSFIKKSLRSVVLLLIRFTL